MTIDDKYQSPISLGRPVITDRFLVGHYVLCVVGGSSRFRYPAIWTRVEQISVIIIWYCDLCFAFFRLI